MAEAAFVCKNLHLSAPDPHLLCIHPQRVSNLDSCKMNNFLDFYCCKQKLKVTHCWEAQHSCPGGYVCPLSIEKCLKVR